MPNDNSLTVELSGSSPTFNRLAQLFDDFPDAVCPIVPFPGFSRCDKIIGTSSKYLVSVSRCFNSKNVASFIVTIAGTGYIGPEHMADILASLKL